MKRLRITTIGDEEIVKKVAFSSFALIICLFYSVLLSVSFESAKFGEN